MGVSIVSVEMCQTESTGVKEVHVPDLGSNHLLVFLMCSLVGLLCQFMSCDADDSSNSFCSSMMAQHGCTGNSLSESTPRSETVMLVVDQVISVLVLLLAVITCAFRCLLDWSVQLSSYACVLLNWCLVP